MNDFEFLRYIHLTLFGTWVVAFVTLVVVVLRDQFKKQK